MDFTLKLEVAKYDIQFIKNNIDLKLSSHFLKFISSRIKTINLRRPSNIPTHNRVTAF